MLHAIVSFVILVLTSFLVGCESGYLEEGGIASAVVIGLIVGLINYFSLLLKEPVLWLAPIFLLTILALLIYLAVWWQRKGKGKGAEAMLLQLVLMGIVFIVAINATIATMGFWNNPMWESIAIIPTTVVGVSTMSFVLVSFIVKHFETKIHSERGE